MGKNDPNSPRTWKVLSRCDTVPPGSSLVLVGLPRTTKGADWALVAVISGDVWLERTGTADAGDWSGRDIGRRRMLTAVDAELTRARRFGRVKRAEAETLRATLRDSAALLTEFIPPLTDTAHGVAYAPANAFGLSLVVSSKAPAPAVFPFSTFTN